MARICRTTLDRWARLLLHFSKQSAYGLNSHFSQSAYGLQYVGCTCLCTEFRSSSIFETIGEVIVHLDVCITWESSQTSMILLNTLLASIGTVNPVLHAMHLKAYYWHCQQIDSFCSAWFQVYSFNFPGPTLNRRNLSFPSESAFAMPAGSWIQGWTEYYEAMKASAMGNNISLRWADFSSLDIQAKVACNISILESSFKAEICVLSTRRLQHTDILDHIISYHDNI